MCNCKVLKWCPAELQTGRDFCPKPETDLKLVNGPEKARKWYLKVESGNDLYFEPKLAPKRFQTLARNRPVMPGPTYNSVAPFA